MGKLYVGIDVSKERSSACGLDERGKDCFFHLSFEMNSTGFAELIKAIDENSDEHKEVAAAMESTACYHINSGILFSDLEGYEGCRCKPAADCKLCQAVSEENEDRQEGCKDYRLLSSGPSGLHFTDGNIGGCSGYAGPCPGTGVVMPADLGGEG